MPSWPPRRAGGSPRLRHQRGRGAPRREGLEGNRSESGSSRASSSSSWPHRHRRHRARGQWRAQGQVAVQGRGRARGGCAAVGRDRGSQPGGGRDQAARARPERQGGEEVLGWLSLGVRPFTAAWAASGGHLRPATRAQPSPAAWRSRPWLGPRRCRRGRRHGAMGRAQARRRTDARRRPRRGSEATEEALAAGQPLRWQASQETAGQLGAPRARQARPARAKRACGMGLTGPPRQKPAWSGTEARERATGGRAGCRREAAGGMKASATGAGDTSDLQAIAAREDEGGPRGGPPLEAHTTKKSASVSASPASSSAKRMAAAAPVPSASKNSSPVPAS